MFNIVSDIKTTYLRCQLKHKIVLFVHILRIIGVNSSKKNRQKVSL